MRLLRTSASAVVVVALAVSPRAFGATSRVTVAIDGAEQYQRIAGFGVSAGFGEAKVPMNAPAAIQKHVLSLLYSPTDGARAECCASVGWNVAQQFAAAMETDKAANAATALFTSHGYFVAPDSPLRGWAKPLWETEWAPFGFAPWDPAWDDGSSSSGFTWARTSTRA